jgi:hypothetical protein
MQAAPHLACAVPLAAGLNCLFAQVLFAVQQPQATMFGTTQQ